MGGKIVVWCLFVFYSMQVDGYVIEVNLPKENSSAEEKNNKTGLEVLIRVVGAENLYNLYNLATSSEADSDTICDTTDKGYKFFKNTQSCYKVHTERATWPAAELTCIREGGQLAVINSGNEAWVLVRQYRSEFRVVHIGVIQIQGSWKTIDGKTLSEAGYEIWDEGKPNNIAGDQYCGAMYPDGSFGDISCSEETAFICEKASISQTQPQNTKGSEDTPAKQDSSSVTEPNPVKIRNNCGTTDPGYVFLNKQSCYKFHKEPTTWNDAEATCVREGGHLAVINSQDEAYFLTRRFSYRWTLFVLGFHKVEGSWRTVNGQTLTEAGYENWRKGDPSNSFGQNCGALRPDGTITDINCDYSTPFICEKDPRSQPPADAIENHNVDMKSDYTFIKSTNTYYKVHTKKATWNDAETTCVREGGHLAVIKSQDEADHFMADFPEESYQVFLGFYFKSNSWVTIQGQTLAETGYENWNVGEPNNASGDQYCGSMYAEGTFDDISCKTELAFICQRKFSVERPDGQPETSSGDETSAEVNPVAKLNDSKCKTMATGYTFYESTRSCYKVHTKRAKWNDAKAACVREGGHLAVINSQDEADILIKLYPEGAEHVFVGFSYHDLWGSSEVYDRRRDGEWSDWLTIDGRTLSEAGYVNWSPGEPNNASGSEYCGTIYGNGKFDDKACDEEFDFICEIQPTF